MDFAVWHEGMNEGTASWVLFVDAASDRFLLSNDEGQFYWKPAAECKLMRVVTPENPRLVVPVQPQQNIAIPTNGLRSLK